jgi:hypothetical protein
VAQVPTVKKTARWTCHAPTPWRRVLPLAEHVTAWAGQAPADLVRSITDDLAAYAATPFNDDMALVAIQRDKPPRPVPAR